MLVDVIQVADGQHPLGDDGFVIFDDARRHARLAEVGGGLGADTGELRQALVWRRRRGRVGVYHRLKQVVNLLGQRVGELRVLDEVGRHPAGDGLPQRGDSVVQALVVAFGRHETLSVLAGSVAPASLFGRDL